MRVYIAGAYSARDKLRSAAAKLEDAGHISTARWLDATHAIHRGTINTAPDSSDEYCRDHVGQDFEDIEESDVLLVYSASALVALDPFCRGHTGSGGRHIETGYALASGLTVVVVGEAENIFHRGACIGVPDLEAALSVLSHIEGGEVGNGTLNP
jgi:hypothetical protein